MCSGKERSDGIILWWKEHNYELTFLQSDWQGIFAVVRSGGSSPWILGVVYASMNVNERTMWESLLRIAELEYPLVAMGDFNVILLANEKSGETLWRIGL